LVGSIGTPVDALEAPYFRIITPITRAQARPSSGVIGLRGHKNMIARTL